MLLESSDLVDNPPLSDSKTIRTSFPGIASRPLYELLPNTSPDASDEYDAIDDDILTDVWDELFAQIGGVKKLPHRPIPTKGECPSVDADHVQTPEWDISGLLLGLY